MQAWDNKPTSKPKIAICIPYNNSWNPEWAMKTRDPLVHFPLDWCEKAPFYVRVPSLPVARDTLVNEALKANADYILFLDSDMVCEEPSDPNIALNVLYQVINKTQHTKEGKIVSALYRAKQKVGFNYAAWKRAPDGQKGYAHLQSWNGNWLEMDVGGFGFCLIDTTVFKEIPKPWFQWNNHDDISEDFYFFELANKYGYNFHVFTDCKLSHLGNMKVKCDGTIVIQEI